MDIYLTELSSGQRLRIPLLPDRLSIRTGALSVSVNIIEKGEVKMPRGTSLTGYSWTGVFPSAALSTAAFVFDWQEPSRIIAKIQEWQQKNSVLQLMITDLSINTDVFIESFTGDYYGVGDFNYTINLTEYRTMTISTCPAPYVPPTDVDTPIPSAQNEFGIVHTNCIDLNIRKAPDVNSPILGKYKDGSRIEILGRDGNWFIVPHENGVNRQAYVYASYIKLEPNSRYDYYGTANWVDTTYLPSAAATTPSSNSGSNYVVQSGDSYFSISLKLYGTTDYAEQIYQINQSMIHSRNAGTGALPYTLYAGMTLQLPAPPTVHSAEVLSAIRADLIDQSAYGTIERIVNSAPGRMKVNVAATPINTAILRSK